MAAERGGDERKDYYQAVHALEKKASEARNRHDDAAAAAALEEAVEQGRQFFGFAECDGGGDVREGLHTARLRMQAADAWMLAEETAAAQPHYVRALHALEAYYSAARHKPAAAAAVGSWAIPSDDDAERARCKSAGVRAAAPFEVDEYLACVGGLAFCHYRLASEQPKHTKARVEQYRRAEALWRRQIDCTPTGAGSLDPLVNLGGLLMKQGCCDEGVAVLAEALELREEHGDPPEPEKERILTMLEEARARAERRRQARAACTIACAWRRWQLVGKAQREEKTTQAADAAEDAAPPAAAPAVVDEDDGYDDSFDDAEQMSATVDATIDDAAPAAEEAPDAAAESDGYDETFDEADDLDDAAPAAEEAPDAAAESDGYDETFDEADEMSPADDLDDAAPAADVHATTEAAPAAGAESNGDYGSDDASYETPSVETDSQPSPPRARLAPSVADPEKQSLRSHESTYTEMHLPRVGDLVTVAGYSGTGKVVRVIDSNGAAKYEVHGDGINGSFVREELQMQLEELSVDLDELTAQTATAEPEDPPKQDRAAQGAKPATKGSPAAAYTKSPEHTMKQNIIDQNVKRKHDQLQRLNIEAVGAGGDAATPSAAGSPMRRECSSPKQSVKSHAPSHASSRRDPKSPTLSAALKGNPMQLAATNPTHYDSPYAKPLAQPLTFAHLSPRGSHKKPPASVSTARTPHPFHTPSVGEFVLVDGRAAPARVLGFVGEGKLEVEVQFDDGEQAVVAVDAVDPYLENLSVDLDNLTRGGQPPPPRTEAPPSPGTTVNVSADMRTSPPPSPTPTADLLPAETAAASPASQPVAQVPATTTTASSSYSSYSPSGSPQCSPTLGAASASEAYTADTASGSATPQHSPAAPPVPSEGAESPSYADSPADHPASPASRSESAASPLSSRHDPQSPISYSDSQPTSPSSQPGSPTGDPASPTSSITGPTPASQPAAQSPASPPGSVSLEEGQQASLQPTSPASLSPDPAGNSQPAVQSSDGAAAVKPDSTKPPMHRGAAAAPAKTTPAQGPADAHGRARRSLPARAGGSAKKTTPARRVASARAGGGAAAKRSPVKKTSPGLTGPLPIENPVSAVFSPKRAEPAPTGEEGGGVERRTVEGVFKKKTIREKSLRKKKEFSKLSLALPKKKAEDGDAAAAEQGEDDDAPPQQRRRSNLSRAAAAPTSPTRTGRKEARKPPLPSVGIKFLNQFAARAAERDPDAAYDAHDRKRKHEPDALEDVRGKTALGALKELRSAQVQMRRRAKEDANMKVREEARRWAEEESNKKALRIEQIRQEHVARQVSDMEAKGEALRLAMLQKEEEEEMRRRQQALHGLSGIAGLGVAADKAKSALTAGLRAAETPQAKPVVSAAERQAERRRQQEDARANAALISQRWAQDQADRQAQMLNKVRAANEASRKRAEDESKKRKARFEQLLEEERQREQEKARAKAAMPAAKKLLLAKPAAEEKKLPEMAATERFDELMAEVTMYCDQVDVPPKPKKLKIHRKNWDYVSGHSTAGTPLPPLRNVVRVGEVKVDRAKVLQEQQVKRRKSEMAKQDLEKELVMWQSMVGGAEKGMPDFIMRVPAANPQKQGPGLGGKPSALKRSNSRAALKRANSFSRVNADKKKSGRLDEKEEMKQLGRWVADTAAVGATIRMTDKETRTAAGTEAQRTMVVAGRTVTMPCSHATYTKLISYFEAIDENSNGLLEWQELQDFAEFTGIKIEKNTFLKMDQDGSGAVDFMEMLQCLFPDSTRRDLNCAAARWGLPSSHTLLEDQVKDPSWMDIFETEDAKEIFDIFKSFQMSDTNFISYSDLRSHLSGHLSDDIIKSCLDHYGTDGLLSVEQFSEMMSALYNTSNKEVVPKGKRSPSPLLGLSGLV